jgi:hypothetical protein
VLADPFLARQLPAEFVPASFRGSSITVVATFWMVGESAFSPEALRDDARQVASEPQLSVSSVLLAALPHLIGRSAPLLPRGEVLLGLLHT